MRDRAKRAAVCSLRGSAVKSTDSSWMSTVAEAGWGYKRVCVYEHECFRRELCCSAPMTRLHLKPKLISVVGEATCCEGWLCVFRIVFLDAYWKCMCCLIQYRVFTSVPFRIWCCWPIVASVVDEWAGVTVYLVCLFFLQDLIWVVWELIEIPLDSFIPETTRNTQHTCHF